MPSTPVYIISYDYMLMNNYLKIFFKYQEIGKQSELNKTLHFNSIIFPRKTKAPRQWTRWGQEFAPFCTDLRKKISYPHLSNSGIPVSGDYKTLSNLAYLGVLSDLSPPFLLHLTFQSFIKTQSTSWV
jgi:hypothetical protein